MRAGHLVRRFFGSLWPGCPSQTDVEWVRGVLAPGEMELWQRMSGPDRRHSVAVGRKVQRCLGAGSARPVLAAALLHDVGKTDADLGTGGRVAATLIGMGITADTVARWAETRGFKVEVARYLQHPDRGAELLRRAGSDPMAVTWARDHHLPLHRCRLDPELAAVLRAADND